MGRQTNAINKAIAAYHAATTQAAIRKAVRAAKRGGYDFIDAAAVHESALSTLIDALNEV